MRKARFLVSLTLIVAAPLVLGACGSSDDGGSDDEGQITDVIETSVTSTDPAECTTLLTQKFNEQTNFETGEDAVRSCEEDAKDTSNDPDSIEVSDINVDGDAAKANVTFTGGGFDGSTLTVALVKEDDQWKLDEITGVPTLNAEGFKKEFGAQLEAEGSIPPQVAQCIGDELQQASDEQIKQTILGGSEDDLVSLFGDCIPSG
jgi:hypothetical protein